MLFTGLFLFNVIVVALFLVLFKSFGRESKIKGTLMAVVFMALSINSTFAAFGYSTALGYTYIFTYVIAGIIAVSLTKKGALTNQ
ncbi:hypothetical protein [Halobacillus campisalis]|uniref:Uncharacterized protein n=1 Tax=Halobacillus campisalis TaxID=435909 RepID=A0ABW2JZQ7_9BACI|nr:hypothetical protein [Halobacillus campisalis]